jgi:hypothetical protein
MVIDLAKLVVKLEAQSSQLISELERSEKRVQAFAKSADKIGGMLQRAFGALTVGTIVAFGKSIIDARGADAAGLKRLEALIMQVNGSVESRAVSAVHDAAARSRRFAFS